MNERYIYGSFSALLILLLSGCASTSHLQDATMSEGQLTTGCRQCEAVLVQPTESYYMQWAEEGYREPAYSQHECSESEEQLAH